MTKTRFSKASPHALRQLGGDRTTRMAIACGARRVGELSSAAKADIRAMHRAGFDAESVHARHGGSLLLRPSFVAKVKREVGITLRGANRCAHLGEETTMGTTQEGVTTQSYRPKPRATPSRRA